MRWPPPVRVSLAPSLFATSLIALLAVGTCVVASTLPLRPPVLLVASIGVAAWALDRIRVVGLRQGPRSLRAFELRGDLTIVVISNDGSACAGRVHADSYVGARLSTIVWRPYGRWRTRSIVVLPDMLPRDDFRRLRVLMRYARSDVAHGNPVSHA
jgi:hypothetical protein